VRIDRVPTLLALSAALVLAACGGGTSTPTPVPTPTPTPTPNALPTFTFTGITQNEAVSTDVNVTEASTLTAVADWTSPADDIDIVFTDTSCTRTDARTIVQGFCTVNARTNSFTNKPERLTADVSPGIVRVYVLNFGPGTESGTLQLTLQKK
jgi:hypothetical protein